MRKAVLALSCLLLVTAGWSTSGRRAQAYPTPAPLAKAWELDFTHAAPRALAVQTLDGRTRWYWYMTYKVVNRTGAERLFVPEFTVASDQGHIVTAGRDVPSSVFDAVKQRVGNPLLESPAKVVGRLLQGEDHAKEGVAIWPDFMNDVARISVFVAGLTGETQVIPNPATGQDVLMAKTLHIEFDVPGTAPSPDRQPVIEVSQTWIMR